MIGIAKSLVIKGRFLQEEMGPNVLMPQSLEILLLLALHENQLGYSLMLRVNASHVNLNFDDRQHFVQEHIKLSGISHSFWNTYIPIQTQREEGLAIGPLTEWNHALSYNIT